MIAMRWNSLLWGLVAPTVWIIYFAIVYGVLAVVCPPPGSHEVATNGEPGNVVTLIVQWATMTAVGAILVDIALAYLLLDSAPVRPDSADDSDFPAYLRIATGMLAIISILWLGMGVLSSPGCPTREAASHAALAGSARNVPQDAVSVFAAPVPERLAGS